jgi:hypothetical protein
VDAHRASVSGCHATPGSAELAEHRGEVERIQAVEGAEAGQHIVQKVVEDAPVLTPGIFPQLVDLRRIVAEARLVGIYHDRTVTVELEPGAPQRLRVPLQGKPGNLIHLRFELVFQRHLIPPLVARRRVRRPADSAFDALEQPVTTAAATVAAPSSIQLPHMILPRRTAVAVPCSGSDLKTALHRSCTAV